MAAGLGFKTFTTGEVLTAGDVNGYLMQGVLVFASAAARNAAITSPEEGQFAFTKDTNGLWYYDGAAWVASGATGDIEGVTAGIGISGGGTSGTVTVTNSMATAIDAKGDLVAGTGADAFSRVAVGSNGQYLAADSSAGAGLAWATLGAYTSWTPTYTGITVGNGTTSAFYTQIGKFVHAQIRFTLGSTSSIGGGPGFSLPVTADNTTLNTYVAHSFCQFLDAGTAQYYGGVSFDSTTTALFFVSRSDGTFTSTQSASSTVPFTFGNGDSIQANVIYRGA